MNFWYTGWGTFVSVVTPLLLGVFCWRRLPRCRLVTAAAGGILLLRPLLIGNGAIWAFYHRSLNREMIGSPAYTTVMHEYERYRARETGFSYLAVGSSQTHHLFNLVDEARPDLKQFTMPGMMIPRYWLYRHHIVSYKPQTVILQLSEFDLCRPALLRAMKTSPAQGVAILPFYFRIMRMPHHEGKPRDLNQLLIGEWIPEYKYEFIFRALARKYLGVLDPVEQARRPPVLNARQQMERQDAILTEDMIAPQSRMLRDFIGFLEHRRIQVVILEGQFHPDGYTPKLRRLNQLVRTELAAIAAEFPQTRFIPREALIEFTADQFLDGFHVTFSDGRLYAEELLRKLSAPSATTTGD